MQHKVDSLTYSQISNIMSFCLCLPVCSLKRGTVVDTQSLHLLAAIIGNLGLGIALTSPNVTSHVFRGGGEEAPVILVRLEDDDVQLGSKVESQGDVG